MKTTWTDLGGQITCLLISVFAVFLVMPRVAMGEDTNVIPLIVMDDVPLPDAIRNLFRQGLHNCILDPRVPGSEIGPGKRLAAPSITVRWTNVTIWQALDRIARSNKLVLIDNPATTVARIAPAGLGIKPIRASQVRADTNGVQSEIRLRDYPLEQAIETLAEGAHLTVTFDPQLPEEELERTIYVCWWNLTCRQALAALLDNYEFESDNDLPTVRRVLQSIEWKKNSADKQDEKPK